MNILGAIILGAIQGFTEFLPVSSSGHLLLAHTVLHLNTGDDLMFDVMLHMGTALAVIIYFWKDLWEIAKQFFSVSDSPDGGAGRRWGFAIIVGTIPAAIAGVLFEKQIETSFRNLHLLAVALIFGSILMYCADWYWKRQKQSEHVTITKGFTIGLFQILALVPGVSRSGSTISGSLFSKLNREEAIRFSFLLSTPIILGSGVKELISARHDLGAIFNLNVLAGFIVAFITGMIAIKFLMKYLRTNTFAVFIWYRLILAALILSFL